MFSWNPKHILVLGLLLVLVAALGAISVVDMTAAQRRTLALVNESNARSELVTEMRYIARERLASLSAMYFTDDSFRRDAELMRFDALSSRFIEGRRRFESMSLTPEEKAAFARALGAARSASAAEDQAAAAISNGDRQGARTLIVRAIHAQSRLLPAYHEIVAYQRKLSQQAMVEAQHTFHENLILMFMLGVAAALGTLAATKARNGILCAENERFRDKELARAALHSIADGVITTDAEDRIDYLNPAAEKFTGWKLEEARGVRLADVYRVVDEATREPIGSPTALGRLHGLESTPKRRTLVARAGQTASVNDSVAPVRNEQGQAIGTVVVFNDVAESRALARQLAWQASHDPLTGLINRHEFERRLAVSIDRARGQIARHALMYIDLDQFKVVNDTCGHKAGDEMLRQIATLLSGQMRECDTLARLNGDEFGVLLEGCPIDRGVEIAEKIRNAIAAFKCSWEDELFGVGASIGLVPIDMLSGSASKVLSAADAACYAAKESGRNRVRLSNGDEEEVRRHTEMRWVSRINKALEEDRFVLYAQEIRPLATADNHRHFEILVRMRDESGELIPPAIFLPAAERYNLIASIDRRVVSRTFEWLATRAGEEKEALFFSINVSGPSLSDENFLDFVVERFDAYGILPGHICFEITETAAIANLNQARRFIAKLKKKGCCFALDDFGTGMSSCAYLKNLSVDFLKIDGVFVKDMVQDPIDRAIVESINRIGHVMGIRTVAEFVENDMILDELREVGVDCAQGYAIHEPEPLSGLMCRGVAEDSINA